MESGKPGRGTLKVPERDDQQGLWTQQRRQAGVASEGTGRCGNHGISPDGSFGMLIARHTWKAKEFSVFDQSESSLVGETQSTYYAKCCCCSCLKCCEGNKECPDNGCNC